MGETFRIAGIADTHFGGSIDYDGISKEEYFEHISDMSDQADIIIHCGDFTDNGDINGAKLAADVFRRSSVPVVGVMGNHDYPRGDLNLVERILREDGGIHLLSGDIYTAYSPTSSVNLIGATGFTTRHKAKMAHSSGMLEEDYLRLATEQLATFNTSMQQIQGKNNIGLLHFQPTKRPRGCKDGDTYSQKSVRSSSYADLFDLHKDNFMLIFHGHDHYGVNAPNKTRQGVDLINIAAPIIIAMTPGIPYRIIETHPES